MEKKETRKGNIHDENFKHNFTSKNVAHDFLKYNLPKEVLNKIDLTTVEIENTEFIPSKYRSKRRADILYSVKDKQGRKLYSLLHLEGQSRHDKSMALRVWEYHVAIGRAHFKKGYTQIPLIITFVLYHGKAKWTSAKSIADMFFDFDLYVSVSLRSPFLINLPKEKIEELKKQGAAAAPQIIMKQQPTGEYCEVLDELYPLMKKHGQDDEENIDYMATTDKHDESLFLDKLCKFDPRTANDYKIMFEVAIRKTEKKALKLGERKGKKEIAKQMLADKKPLAEVSKYTGITVTELKKMSTKRIKL